MKQLAKNRYVFFGLLAVFIAGVVFAAAEFLNKPSSFSETASATRPITARELALIDKDSDSDGLKDWEETLWKTDPKNSDTDGDGATDAEEIKISRDPTVAGPNDKLDIDTVKKKTTSGTAPLTETDKFSRDFFGTYLILKQQGQPIDSEVEQRLIDSVISNQKPLEGVRIYDFGDLKIGNDESQAALRRYGNAVGEVLKTNPGGENELEIVNRAVEKGDATLLNNLAARIRHYESARDTLLNIQTPKSSATLHLDLVNSLNVLAATVNAMTKLFEDPVRTLGTIQAYPESASAFFETTQAVSAYLRSQGIRFNPSEAGYIFENIQ